MNKHSIHDEAYLYHYTTLQTALEKILPSGMLRLGPFCLTNDPRESKDWFFTFSKTGEQVKAKDIHHACVTISSEIKRGCKALCFSMDNEIPAKNSYSLSNKGCGKPTMWAQYADNHRGICLVLKKDKLIETAKQALSHKGKLYCNKVEYYIKDQPFDMIASKVDWEQISNGCRDVARKLFNEHYKYYFFMKHVDWQHENEYRIILKSEDDEPEYISIREALQEVILGADFPEIYRIIIEQFCKQQCVPVKKIFWYNGVPVFDE